MPKKAHMRMSRKARLRKKSLTWRFMLALNSTQGPWAYLQAGGEEEQRPAVVATWARCRRRTAVQPEQSRRRAKAGAGPEQVWDQAHADQSRHEAKAGAGQRPASQGNTAADRVALVLRELAVPIRLRLRRHLQLFEVKGAVPARTRG